MSGRFDGKVAVVNGAGGVGRDVALLLAREGASVVVNDRDFEGAASPHGPADQVAEEVRLAGGKAIASHHDVASMDGGERLIAAAMDAYGRLDILVNSIAARRDRAIGDMTPEDFGWVVTQNVKGTFVPTRYAAVHFRQQRGGRIVSIISDAGIGETGASNFAAASEAIVGLNRTVARDLGKYGITCNAIGLDTRPGPGAADGPQNAASLAVLLCTQTLPNVNGYVFGVHGGSVRLYSDPAIERSIHKWGTFTMDEMDSLAHGLFSDASVDTVRPPVST